MRTLVLLFGLLVIATPIAMAANSPHRTPKESSLLPEPPVVSAPAYIVFDASDNTTLTSHNATEQRAIASLTKLMTALVVVEHTDGSEKVTIIKQDLIADGGSGIGMKVGDTFTVDNLVEAMLVYSANDAAVALARYVGNTQAGFIEQMNTRAKKLSMSNTTFSSVNGLDSAKGNVSTADDLIRLAEAAMSDDRIAQAVALPSITVVHKDGTTAKYDNRNPFLETYKGVDGVKTGTTDFAGHCLLVHYADKDSKANIYTLVLGEKSVEIRDADTKALLDWARSLRPEVKISEAGEIIGSVPVTYRKKPLSIFAEDDLSVRIRIGSTIKEKLIVPEILEPPFKAGDAVGKIIFYADGKKIGQTRVYVATGMHKQSQLDLVRLYASEYRQAWHEGTSRVRHKWGSARRYWGL